jgi:hypothetical protein
MGNPLEIGAPGLAVSRDLSGGVGERAGCGAGNSPIGWAIFCAAAGPFLFSGREIMAEQEGGDDGLIRALTTARAFVVIVPFDAPGIATDRLISRARAAIELGRSRSWIDSRIRDGSLGAVRQGEKTYVRAESVRKMLGGSGIGQD